MNFENVIKACEQAGGAGSKKIIQAELAKADHSARMLIYEALNPYRVFNVKKFDKPSSFADITNDQQDSTPFFNLLDKLHRRELTGNAAREAVTRELAKFNYNTQFYLTRVLDKDLKAGFSADTFNKVWPNEPIPTFEVMLADKCEDIEDFEKNITFPCQGDFKYDGERTIIFVKENQILYYSRSGKPADHISGLFDEELQKIRINLGYDFILDGERVSDRGFIDTVNAKKSGNDEAKANLRFRTFFYMSLEDWLAQKCSKTMLQCRNELNELLQATDCKKIILTEGRIVNNYQDMMEYCNEAIDKPENASRKIEGLILKQLDSVYEWDRKMTWCKVKRFFDVDCRIIGFYNGRAKSRLENTLGGITVMGYLEDGTKVVTNVGSGFSDDLRDEIINNLDKYMGMTAVICYQEVTKSKNKEFHSLRFPTFIRVRDDKVVE